MAGGWGEGEGGFGKGRSSLGSGSELVLKVLDNYEGGGRD